MSRLIRRCVSALALFAAASLSAVNYIYTELDVQQASPTKAGEQFVSLGRITAPCEIVGSISKTGVRHVLLMDLDIDRPVSASVFTHSGTGAVFKAETRFGEGEWGPVLGPTTPRTIYESSMVNIIVSAEKAVEGAKYSVRIGNFGDFQVAFNGNGGSVTKSSETYIPGQKYGKFPTALYIGHEFKGWYTEKSGGVRISTNTIVCTSYTNLFAQWSASAPPAPTNDLPVAPSVTNYTVRFLANGGYGSMPTQTFTYGEAKALATNVFARTNYTFQGWAKSATGTAAYRDCEVVSNLTSQADSVVDLYASWMVGADQIKSAVVDGVTWHYLEDGGLATIVNLDGSNYVAAISTSYRGNLVIPESLNGLPVTAIGENAFLNCSAVTNVVIPTTVISIGSSAFAGCSRLAPGITIPESVTDLGSRVFAGCDNLRIVRYLGDCPDVDPDLYEDAPARLVSGVLRVRRDWASEEEIEIEVPESDDDVGDETDIDDLGELDLEDDVEPGTVTVLQLPERWPEDGEGRGIYWLKGVKIFTVTLYGNGGKLDTDFDESRLLYYLPGRPLGELPEPTFTLLSEDDETEVNFLGWYTAKSGGVKVNEDDVVDRSLKLYAHWMVGGTEVSGWQEGLYDDGGEFSCTSARVYDGYLYNEAGSNDCQVVGTVTIKVSKGKYDREEEATNATVKATVSLLGQKKLTFKGVVDESGMGELESSAVEDTMSVELTGNGLAGSFGDYTIAGARNRTSSPKQIDKLFVSTQLARWKGSWNVVLQATDVQGTDAESVADCYCTLTATVGNKGKTKITGTMADGTKVSVSSTMIFGDGCGCVPVCVPLYPGKKGGFAFLLWFCTDEEEPMIPWGVGDWVAKGGKLQFISALTSVAYGPVAELPWTSGSFMLDGSYDFEDFDLDDSLLPDAVPVKYTGSKWQLPGADRIKFIREDGMYEVATDRGNPAGLKLSYTKKTGSFKGSFKLYGVKENGSSKKLTATVSGVVVDGIGYGSAYVKPLGSVPVMVVEE